MTRSFALTISVAIVTIFVAMALTVDAFAPYWGGLSPYEKAMGSALLVIAFALASSNLFWVVSEVRRRMTPDEAGGAEQAMQIDPLTGVYSRYYFVSNLEARLRRRGEDGKLAILLLDLDRFKWLNDTFGHHAGDQILAHVGRVLSREAAGGLVGRFGGDEFAVALHENVGSPEEALQQAERIRRALAEAAPVVGRQIRTEATVGIALAPDHGDSAEEVLLHADIALYSAKKAGRNDVRIFTQQMLDHQKHKKFIERELFAALAAGELELHYQPLIRLSDGAVFGLESLIRWRHAQRGYIPPSEFIAIAEESALIEEVGDWVIGTVCRDAHLLPDVRIGINVSPVQLRMPDFATRLLSRLARQGVEPTRIALEITETLLFDANPQQIEQLSLLRDRGIRISLDDFGSGYSSLKYLRELPISSLKIDKYFVQNLHMSHESRVFVAAIAQFGKGLDITVIAEGVETEAHELLVRGAGCEVSQGYLYAKAMPLSDAYAFVRRRKIGSAGMPDRTARQRASG